MGKDMEMITEMTLDLPVFRDVISDLQNVHAFSVLSFVGENQFFAEKLISLVSEMDQKSSWTLGSAVMTLLLKL